MRQVREEIKKCRRQPLGRQAICRLLLCVACLLLHFSCLITPAKAQGYPLIRNYTAAEYGAHNRNYDIDIGADGTVFVANFEGLLYYDRAQWRIIHTPDINRTTVVYRASDDVIWVGGYNFFARVETKKNGDLTLKRVGRADLFRGEVMEIFERDGTLQFVASDNNIYEVKNDQAVLKERTNANFRLGLESEIVEVDKLKEGYSDVVLEGITQDEPIDGGIHVQVKRNKGLVISDDKNHVLYTIDENHGLCSNNVAYVAYDGHGLLWGATDHGIFSIELPSVYSYWLPVDGLSGEMHAITAFAGSIFVGSSNGLYRLDGMTPKPVSDINAICWDFAQDRKGLLVATSNGVYRIAPNGNTTRLTMTPANAVMADDATIYIGAQDGLYAMQDGSEAKKVCNMDKVTKIVKDDDGAIWLQNVYGAINSKQPNDSNYKPYHTDKDGTRVAATIVEIGGKVMVVTALDTVPIAYPAFSQDDADGVAWLTDRDGRHLYRWKPGKADYDRETAMLTPLGEMSVSALFSQGSKVWIGGDDKMVVIDRDKKTLQSLVDSPQLRFRSVIWGPDNVLWGGYGDMPQKLPDLDSDERRLRFTYAVSHEPLTGETLYRYRLNDDKWSAWSDRQEAEFLNLPYGSFRLSIQARLGSGELTDVISVEFTINYPLFLRWYMGIIYLLLAVGLSYALFRLRLRKLKADKQKLEAIVKERTSEVVKQKDSLEKALDELHSTQNQLIRQEKMATVGKLTQGLIDRILNPMNYIINFSKLSEGLLGDIRANIEDDKDSMKPDNYDDTCDVLDMLDQNLKSVDQYGQNTSRILKAMEEMLKDRSGGMVDMDLLPVLQQNQSMLGNYFAKDCEEHHIDIRFELPGEPMVIHGNPDLLSKTFMSILGNAVYALVKKKSKTAFDAKVSLSATIDNEVCVIKIHDNGTGIGKTTLEKIFDPFFTTKTSDEATGVGLYLSRETIQNHGGDIAVESVKDEYTEFTITLPILKGRVKSE